MCNMQQRTQKQHNSTRLLLLLQSKKKNKMNWTEFIGLAILIALGTTVLTQTGIIPPEIAILLCAILGFYLGGYIKNKEVRQE